MTQGDFVGDLNRKAGITDPAQMLEAAGAANLLAGTTGLELVAALNKAANTTDLEFLAALNLALAGAGGAPGGGGGGGASAGTSDSFNRADGPLGDPWAVLSGAVAISGQQVTGTGTPFAVVPLTGTSHDLETDVVFTDVDTMTGLAVTSPTNTMSTGFVVAPVTGRAYLVALYATSNLWDYGKYLDIGSLANGTHRLRMVISGRTVTGYVNGVEVISHTYAPDYPQFPADTDRKGGLYSTSGSASTFDNFTAN